MTFMLLLQLLSSLSFKIMSDESLDLFEQEFWSEVQEFADELGLPVSYVEEEFVIMGELVRQAKDM